MKLTIHHEEPELSPAVWEISGVNKIRVAIINSEAIVRGDLQACLEGHPRIEVVAEYTCACEAARFLEQEAPDVILLGGETSGGDGIQVLEQASPVPMPLIVIVTAHAEHALEAFRVRAFDYVLKPVDKRTLLGVFDRVFAHVENRYRGDLDRRLSSVLLRLEERENHSGGESPQNGSP